MRPALSASRWTRRLLRGGSSARALACAAGLAVAALGPRGALAQSLEDAQRAAFENSLVLRSDAARQDGAEARLRGSIDAFLPTVSGVVSKPLRSRITYSPDIPRETFGPETTPRKRPNEYGVVVDLPLFDGLQRWNTFRSSHSDVAAGRKLTDDARQQLLYDTATAYLAIVRDRKILSHRQRQRASLEAVRRSVDAQFAINNATRTDVALAQSRVIEAAARISGATADLAASELDYKRLTGAAASAMARPQAPPPPRSEAELANLVRGGNARLAASWLDVRSAEFQADAAKGALLPQLAFQLTHGRQTDVTSTLDTIRETTATLQLRIPLYQPGSIAKVYEAAALAREKRYAAEDASRRAGTDASAALQRHAALKTQTASLGERVSVLRAAVRGYEIERGAGFRTVLDELNGRAELAEAEVLQSTAEAERDRVACALAAVTGRLSPPGDEAPVVRGGARPPFDDVVVTGSVAASPKPARAKTAARRKTRVLAKGTTVAALTVAELGLRR